MSKDNDLEARVELAKDRLNCIATFNERFDSIIQERIDVQAMNAASEFKDSLNKIRQKILRRETLVEADRTNLVKAEEFLRIVGKI